MGDQPKMVRNVKVRHNSLASSLANFMDTPLTQIAILPAKAKITAWKCMHYRKSTFSNYCTSTTFSRLRSVPSLQSALLAYPTFSLLERGQVVEVRTESMPVIYSVRPHSLPRSLLRWTPKTW